jgi:hypothetical protein
MVRIAVRFTYAAASWSCGYGLLGVHWTLGGSGFPFGVGHDPAAHLSVLGDAPPGIVAPAIAIMGLLGTLIAILMARGAGLGWLRVALIIFAATLAIALAIVIPDFRILVVVAYAPILLLGAPFGWPPDVRFFDAIPWPLINQAVCMIGGVAWALAAVEYQRRSRGSGGRSRVADTWNRLLASRRFGSTAVAAAVVIPILYAVTRWAWALGYPLGITEAFFRDGQAVGLWWMGAALGTLALVAAVLTLGLIRPWGEKFPRAIPYLGGRRVPPRLIVVPASLAAAIITSAGLMFVRLASSGTLTIGDHPITLSENWGALAPELLWPVWGLSVGAATLAYHQRTQQIERESANQQTESRLRPGQSSGPRVARKG